MSAATENCLVLVVEDDNDVREMIGMLLGTFGYAMLGASTQEAARDLFAARVGSLRAIMLDGNVPQRGKEGSTVELARWFRERFSGLIVAIPASEDRLRELLEVITIGGPAVGLKKPFNLDGIRAAFQLS